MSHPVSLLRPVSLLVLCAVSLSACTATGDLIANLRSDRPDQTVDGPRRAPMLNAVAPTASAQTAQAAPSPLLTPVQQPMNAQVAQLSEPAPAYAPAAAPEPAPQLEQGMQPVSEPILAASPSQASAPLPPEQKAEESPSMFGDLGGFFKRHGISGETDPRLAKALGETPEPTSAGMAPAPLSAPQQAAAPAPAATAPAPMVTMAPSEPYASRKPLPGNPIVEGTPRLTADADSTSVKKSAKKGKKSASKKSKKKVASRKSKKKIVAKKSQKEKVEVAANDKKKEEFPALSTVPPTPPAMGDVKDNKAESQKALEDALTKSDGEKKALDQAPFQSVTEPAPATAPPAPAMPAAPPAPPLAPTAPPADAAPVPPAPPAATTPAATPAAPPPAPAPPAPPAGIAAPPPPPPVVPSAPAAPAAPAATASSGGPAAAPAPAAPAPAVAPPAPPPPPPPPPPPGASKDADEGEAELAARLGQLAPAAGSVQPSRTVIRLPESRYQQRGIATSVGTDL